MFEINYFGKKTKINHWIKLSPLHFKLLDDEGNMIDSKVLEGKDLLTLLQLNQNQERERRQESDYQQVKISHLDFCELIEIYGELDATFDLNMKNKITAAMKDLLFQYKVKGCDPGLYTTEDCILQLMELETEEKDKNIDGLLEEYRDFLTIKAYEFMPLYELLGEKDRFQEVLKDQRKAESLGFPYANKEKIKHRFLPSLKVLIAFKEDQYMMELLSFHRQYKKLNPFLVTEEDIQKYPKESFFFHENAVLVYDYVFFEQLGLKTLFLERELSQIRPYQYPYLCEYLYGIAMPQLHHMIYYKKFYEKILHTRSFYGEEGFVAYFIQFLYRELRY